MQLGSLGQRDGAATFWSCVPQCVWMHCKLLFAHKQRGQGMARDAPTICLLSSGRLVKNCCVVVEISLHTINFSQGCIIPRVRTSPCPRFWHVSFAYGWMGERTRMSVCVWMLSFAALVSFSFSLGAEAMS
jgi:hypothetical protein